MQTVTYTKESGWTTKRTDLVNINISMVLNMKDTGKKINSMDMVVKFGLMVPLLKGIMWMGKSKARALLLGPIAALTQEISSKTIFTGRAFINGRMVVFIRVRGKTIKCMATEYSLGLMEDAMKVNIAMIRSMGRAHFNGLMVESMLEGGTMANNMEKEHTCQLMDIRNRGSGT